jgi:hypothetical protein
VQGKTEMAQQMLAKLEEPYRRTKRAWRFELDPQARLGIEFRAEIGNSGSEEMSHESHPQLLRSSLSLARRHSGSGATAALRLPDRVAKGNELLFWAG